jgi:hypothetical protein
VGGYTPVETITPATLPDYAEAFADTTAEYNGLVYSDYSILEGSASVVKYYVNGTNVSLVLSINNLFIDDEGVVDLVKINNFLISKDKQILYTFNQFQIYIENDTISIENTDLGTNISLTTPILKMVLSVLPGSSGGSVKSVNTVGPDSSGDVEISATDIYTDNKQTQTVADKLNQIVSSINIP